VTSAVFVNVESPGDTSAGEAAAVMEALEASANAEAEALQTRQAAP
jgi:hypothetical protein